MLQYLTEIYFNIYAYGLWIFIVLAGLTIGGGLILMFAMADNGEKGTLDFSLEYMARRRVEYGTVISYWKKIASVFVMVALAAIFAPSEEVVNKIVSSNCSASE